MRNRILASFRDSIPYVKQLRPIARSAVGCLVMQQLDYWFAKTPDGFYKFLSPCNAPRYRKGDSWTEELGISVDEFRTAFDKIGIRHKSKTAYEQAESKFANKDGEELLYCSYTDKVQGVTRYFRNHEAVDAALDALIGVGGAIPGDGQSPSTEMGNGNSRKWGIPSSSDPSETTSENTHRRSASQIKLPRLPGSDDDLDDKAQQFHFSILEDPSNFGYDIVTVMCQMFPELPIRGPNGFYAQWSEDRIINRGLGKGRKRAKSTIREYAKDFQNYLRKCENNRQGRTNGNGYGNGAGKVEQPRQKTVYETLKSEGKI